MADTNEKTYCGIERTLIVFKPDAVQRGIVGEILQRFITLQESVSQQMLSATANRFNQIFEGKTVASVENAQVDFSAFEKDIFSLTLDEMKRANSMVSGSVWCRSLVG